MPFDKRIITHEACNRSFSNGFVISDGRYGRSIAFYHELAAEARKDFPDLKDEDIECFVIIRSSYNQGYAGIRFSLPANTRMRGWRHDSSLDFSHS